MRDALWDVFFTRISGVEEYGFQSGLEKLMWATDQLGDPLLEFDWEGLKRNLEAKAVEWTDLIIEHAQADGAFFPDQREDPEDEPTL